MNAKTRNLNIYQNGKKMLKETKLEKKTRENIGIHRKSMQNSKVVYAKEKLIKASSCRRRICVQHIYILTPF